MRPQITASPRNACISSPIPLQEDAKAEHQ
jgi:hypothetical protein